ncbi:MAG: DUF1295 domain-containing protein [Eubacteriales bacterium]|nr:DUF1295 domain-containing protein [Lachnospiraceae bacterium]MDO4417954.1 DUF1295 domain-containing protein [Eubacteriales bacterium]
MSILFVFLAALLASSIGFHMYIWFFSVGYGLSIAAIAVVLAAGFHRILTLPALLACLLLVLYGLRLSGYLLFRESRSTAYRHVLNPEIERSKKMPLGAKLALWLSCALLYTLMTSPLYFRLYNGTPADPMLWIGILFMALGILLETVADHQKTLAKKKNSRRFVDTGLYRIVRCPNYLGELLLWLGMLLTGMTALRGPLQWISALLGFLLIVWVMFSGARRLEIRQDANYGDDPDYQKYVRTVPILLPFIPLYSVKKYKFLVA